MNTVRFLIFSIILAIVGLANLASVPSTESPPQTSNPPCPITSQSTAIPNQGISRNWSGYAATNGTFTGISGTWTVPQLSNSASFGADAAWVGIGGVKSRDLIQAGTQAVADPSGGAKYQAFFETLPNASQPLPISIASGDSVTASITQTASNRWLVSLKNNTTGQIFQIIQSYNSSLSSAEWIEEAPSSTRRVLPLDNFGTVKFTDTATINNGQPVNLAQANAQPITMIDRSGNILATPSHLSSDNTSFNVTRTTDLSIRPSPSNSC